MFAKKRLSHPGFAWMGFRSTGGTTYSWTGPNNFSSSDQFNKISSADTSLSGMYDVVVYDQVKDTTYLLSVQVTVNNSVDFSIIVDMDQYWCINSTMLLAGEPGWVSYHWTGPNLNAWGIKQYIFLTNTSQTGTYTLTVTNGIITRTESIQITVLECCAKSEARVLHNGVLSDYLKDPMKPILVIDGNVTIDQSYDFNAAGINEIILLSSTSSTTTQSAILTLPNINLTWRKLFIHGCQGMWNGIFSIGPSSFKMTECQMYDGEKGCHIYQYNIYHSYLAITDNSFTNNFTALTIDGTPLSLIFTKNRFMTSGGLLPPYSNEKGYVGLRLNEAKLSFVNYGIDGVNTFDNLRNGIICENCEYVDFKKNSVKFSNIVGHYLTTPSMVDVEGCAIFSYFNLPNSLLGGQIYKFGNDLSLGFDFDNCTHGIYTRHCNIKIESNSMHSVNTGIQVDQSQHMRLEILGNDIICNRKGIFLYQNDNVGETKIIRNYITLDNVKTLPLVTSCIELSESNNEPDICCIITENKLYTKKGCKYGILCNTTNKTVVTENEVYMTEPKYNESGIYIENGSYHTVNCNYIYGPGILTSGQVRLSGIRMESSPYSEYSCNIMSDTYIGMKVGGNCYPTTIRGNTIGYHQFGLLYDNQGVTGDETDQGNMWTTPCLVYDAYHPNYIISTFSTYFANYLTSPWWPYSFFPNQIPNVWFQPSANFPFICSDLTVSCSDIDGLSDYRPHYDSGLARFDTAVATREIPLVSNNDAILWGTSKELYQKLLDQPQLLIGNAIMHIFIDSVQYETPAAYQQLEMQGKDVFNIPVSSRLLIDSVRIVMSALQDSIQLIDSLLLSQPSLYDSLQYISIKSNLLNKVNNNLILTQTASIEYTGLRDLKSLAVLNTNSGLPAMEDYTSNTNIVNNIYYNTIGKGIYSLTANQVQSLLSVAVQCPVTGGTAVYAARSILTGYTDLIYNDEEICLSADVEKSIRNSENPLDNLNFFCYPNPVMDNFTINWEVSFNEIADLNLYNSIGQCIFTGKITFSGNSKTIDVSDIPGGVYSIQLVNKGFKKNLGKVVILRH